VTATVERFGTPPRVFAEVRALMVAPGEVWCVLRPREKGAPWLALEIVQVQGVMRRGRTLDLAPDLRERLRASGQWPQHWGK
jgi:hypothetical protein